jgi:hypothetical protein
LFQHKIKHKLWFSFRAKNKVPAEFEKKRWAWLLFTEKDTSNTDQKLRELASWTNVS